MTFQGKSRRTRQEYVSPEEMYAKGALRRTGNAVAALWVHQGDVIRSYADNHQATPDLALELPTGSRKTLPGLLIAEWVRRKGGRPVIYAAPTQQLARQVLATAQTEGVPGALLVGSHHDWPTAELSDVEGSEAIGVTTYSAVFPYSLGPGGLAAAVSSSQGRVDLKDATCTATRGMFPRHATRV